MDLNLQDEFDNKQKLQIMPDDASNIGLYWYIQYAH